MHFSERNKKGILNHAFLFHLSEENINGIQNDWSLFSFSEGNNKGIQNNALLFPFSEESIKRIQNDEFLFPFLWHKQNRKLNFCLHPPGNLIPRLSPHANGAWKIPRGGEGGLRDLVTCRARCHVTWTKGRRGGWFPTINFALICLDLSIDDSIQVSIRLCKTVGWWLQHSILNSFDVWTESFTYEFHRFLSEIWMISINIQHAELRAEGWTKSARTTTPELKMALTV